MCAHCGGRLPPGVHFCPRCGAFHGRLTRLRRTLRLAPGVDPSEKRLGVERTKAGLALMAMALALYSIPILGMTALLPGALGAGFLISGSRPFRGNHALLTALAAVMWAVGAGRLLFTWQALVINTRFNPAGAEAYYHEFFAAAVVAILLQVVATALLFAGLQDDRGLALIGSAGFVHGGLAALFLYATRTSILHAFDGDPRLWDPGFADLQQEVFFLTSMSTVGNVAWVPISLRTRRRLIQGRIPLRRTELDPRIE